MAFNKNAFVFFLILLSEVTSWTVDLPEVRKFLFEKYDESNENDKVEIIDDGRKFYSNIEGNSLHNTEPRKDDYDKNNANDYGYVTYMEKKVGGIVRNGTAYLEGLRRAIERYIQYLESCSNRNNSMTFNITDRLPLITTPPTLTNRENMTSNFSTIPPNVNFPPNLLSNDSNMAVPSSRFNDSDTVINCDEVNEKSERVRRLAQLAMWTTMRLQDLGYAKKYQKTDEYEENELILKLAWFLDRLAYLTGYEPEPKRFLPRPVQRLTTVAPTALTLVPAPEPIKTQMMNCIKENSSEPATERCRYPLPIPDLIRQIINSTGNSTFETSTESMNVVPMPSQDSIPQQSLELLITSDDNPFGRYPPFTKSRIHKRHIDSSGTSYNAINNPFSFLDNFKNKFIRLSNKIPNRLTSKFGVTSSKKSLKKRSLDNPMNKLIDYDFKYKTWDALNPIKADKIDNFSPKSKDVGDRPTNKKIVKRSLFTKKDGHIVLEPLKTLKSFIKHKAQIHYNAYLIQKPKIISHLETIRHQININKSQEKKIVHKRSIHYENMYLPRQPANPFGDISFYVKNKEGTEYNPSLTQAARVRLGLEQIFQTGNIEVVRRYGSNYNPADPAPFYTGILRSLADS